MVNIYFEFFICTDHAHLRRENHTSHETTDSHRNLSSVRAKIKSTWRIISVICNISGEKLCWSFNFLRFATILTGFLNLRIKQNERELIIYENIIYSQSKYKYKYKKYIFFSLFCEKKIISEWFCITRRLTFIFNSFRHRI